MNSIYSFIIKPKKNRYNNTKKIQNKNLILNTSIEDHKFVSRNAIVVSVPKAFKTNIKVGDEIIVHHNTFRRFYDVRGNEKDSSNYFRDNLYFCYIDQIFLYKRNDKWHTPPGFCFVKPIHSLNNLTEDKEEPLTGVLKHIGDDLRSFGLEDNDLIGFTPNSEYEFIIDNERLYRVPINSISIKYGRKGSEVEYNPKWQ